MCVSLLIKLLSQVLFQYKILTHLECKSHLGKGFCLYDIRWCSIIIYIYLTRAPLRCSLLLSAPILRPFCGTLSQSFPWPHLSSASDHLAHPQPFPHLALNDPVHPAQPTRMQQHLTPPRPPPNFVFFTSHIVPCIDAHSDCSRTTIGYNLIYCSHSPHQSRLLHH
jgi:hypothetical protein